ncbi:MAG: cupin domain-containing protein, partial [Myxococcota bacterium]
MVFVLEGEAVLVDDNGAHIVRAGDAVVWKAGAKNAHHLINRSASPCVYLVIGTRVRDDVCHYPDSGRLLRTEGRRWRLVNRDGTLRREGELDPPFPCRCDDAS